jgi:hypothetical protein
MAMSLVRLTTRSHKSYVCEEFPARANFSTARIGATIMIAPQTRSHDWLT